MSAPIRASLAALALAICAPAYAQVESSSLNQVDSWGTGWLGKDDGAMPATMWANTNTATLTPLFAAAQPLQLAPSARAALRRVALSAAKGPDKADALIPERLRIIEQLGETPYSIDLRRKFPDTPWGKTQERLTADYELVQGQSKAACARAADKRGDDVAWMPVRAFCFALAKDFNAASAAAERIPVPKDGKADGWLLSAISMIEAPTRIKPDGRYGAPLEAAVSIAAKLPVPVNAFVATPPDVAAFIISHPDATLEQKRAALRPALDGGMITPAQVVEILLATEKPPEPATPPAAPAPAKEGEKPAAAKPAPPPPPAPPLPPVVLRPGQKADFLTLALLTAASKDAKPAEKATAYAAALKSAETMSDFHVAAVALADPIKALPRNADTFPNAETFARSDLFIGDTKGAQDWRKLMDLPPAPPKDAKAKPDPKPPAKPAPAPAPPPKDAAAKEAPPKEAPPKPEPYNPETWAAARIDLMLSYAGVGADKSGALLDKLVAALPAAPEGAAKAATPASRQIDLRRIENTRFLFLHAGMGRDLSPGQRALLASQKSAGRGISDAAIARIAAAADQDADGEAALAAIPLLGPDVSAASFAGLSDLLIQMRRIGLAADANAIALESMQVWKAL